LLFLVYIKSRVIILIFAVTAGDVGKDLIHEKIKSTKLVKKFRNVEILWISERESYNYLKVKKLACHIITI
jgi:transaldolase